MAVYDSPPLSSELSGFDQIGKNCMISNGVWVKRSSHKPDRGVFLGDGVMIFDSVHIVVGSLDANPNANIVLGNRVIINVGGYISGEGGLVIEDDVLIGPHVRILSAGHGIHGGHSSVIDNPLTYAPIRIGRGAWIGGGSTILQGVAIGEGAVVGAGSVVPKSVPPFAVVVGNPARIKRYREGYAPKPWWSFWKFN
jgi:acetyltransferase-like isoleucine patch superfamily enzyme